MGLTLTQCHATRTSYFCGDEVLTLGVPSAGVVTHAHAKISPTDELLGKGFLSLSTSFKMAVKEFTSESPSLVPTAPIEWVTLRPRQVA